MRPNNVYLQYSLPAMERLMGLVDKNPLSPTYGCFDKTYWHHRLTDFPSITRQQGILCLAYFYKWISKQNPYQESKEILSIVEGAVLFTVKNQHKDGSYDEWYPNERGWAGPTGYISYALAKTYELLREELSTEVKNILERSLLKSGEFLAYGWESHILSNHIAMALLPVYMISELFNSDRLKIQYKNLLEKFLCYFNDEEGWGVEYDGPDVGYQSATLSFLSRLYEYDSNRQIKKVCERSLDFISYFCFPDGSFSRKFGSRQCEVLFHYGVEYWAGEDNPLAKTIAAWSRNSLAHSKQLLPQDHEDHYFIYRMVEFIEAGFYFQKRKSEVVGGDQLPFEKEDFQKVFKAGKLLIQKKEDYYLLVNIGRGGAFLLFDCEERELQKVDYGHAYKTKKGDLLTTLDFDPQIKYSLRSDHLLVEGDLSFWDQKKFSPIKMVLFRTFMILFGWHHKLSYVLKTIIRKLLLKQNHYSSLSFKRKISLTKFGEIQDELINNEGVAIEENISGGLFEIRYVPQSRYFKSSDLKHLPGKSRR